MIGSEPDPFDGIVIDEKVEVSLDEVTLYCSVRRQDIRALVAEGVLHPRGRTEAEWRFAGHAMHRAAKALRLQRDLEVNTAAVGLILDLLDEIERLRARAQPIGDRTDR